METSDLKLWNVVDTSGSLGIDRYGDTWIHHQCLDAPGGLRVGRPVRPAHRLRGEGRSERDRDAS